MREERRFDEFSIKEISKGRTGQGEVPPADRGRKKPAEKARKMG
jgi:hypothetical protein